MYKSVGMKFIPLDLIFAAAVWYLVWAVFTIAMYPPAGGVWTETFKAVGTAMAIATALFAPVASVVMARYQGQLTRDLEELKKDYTGEIERLKNALSSELEVKKALIAGRVRAFDAMLTAAHFYYFVLRRLATHNQEGLTELMGEADRRSAEASSVVWHLDSLDRTKCFSVYQRSAYIASVLVDSLPEDRQRKFDDEAPALGTAIEELETAGLKVFADADKVSIKVAEDEVRISSQPLIR